MIYGLIFGFYEGKFGFKFNPIILGRRQASHIFGYPICIKHTFIRTHTRISYNIFFYCYIRTHDVHPLHFVHFTKHMIIMFDFFLSTIVVASQRHSSWIIRSLFRVYEKIQSNSNLCRSIAYRTWKKNKILIKLTSTNKLLTKYNLIDWLIIYLYNKYFYILFFVWSEYYIFSKY